MAYVSKAAGLPLDVEFVKSAYGPYAKTLGLRVNRLISNKLIKETRAGSMMRIEIGNSYEGALSAYLPEIHKWEPIIEKVSDLFMRANTTQAELIATIIYSANMLVEKKHYTPSEKEVVREVLDWKQLRYSWLTEQSVAMAVRNLAALDWLKVQPTQGLLTADLAS
jgi:uncharacterized protein YwgA